MLIKRTILSLALAAAVGFLWIGVARAEAPRIGQTCAGIYNKAKGWMNEEGEICKFNPADVQRSRAKLADVGGADILKAPGLEHVAVCGVGVRCLLEPSGLGQGAAFDKL